MRPEAAVPGLPRYNAQFANPILDLAHDHNTWMIIGADDAEVTATGRSFARELGATAATLLFRWLVPDLPASAAKPCG